MENLAQQLRICKRNNYNCKAEIRQMCSHHDCHLYIRGWKTDKSVAFYGKQWQVLRTLITLIKSY